MYSITNKMISGLPKIPYRHGKGKPEGIVLHETGAWGGTALGNRNFEANHWRKAFVHFFVDWQDIIQVANTDYIAYGAGEVANERFIHIELVRTRDKVQFKASYDRYVWLAAKMLIQYGLKPERLDTLWTHHDVTNHLGGTTHNDPDAYLAYHGYTVDQLINDIEKSYTSLKKGGSKMAGAFKDVPKDHWANAALENLKAKGIITGYSDGTFKPDNPITRAEYAAGLDKLLKYLGK